jgi:hypothetical protein
MERIATAEGSAASLKRRWTTGYLNQEIDDPIVLAPTSSGVILRSVSVTPLRGRALRLVLGNCHEFMTKERLWEFLERFRRGPVELYGEMELLSLLTSTLIVLCALQARATSSTRNCRAASKAAPAKGST